MKRCKTCRWWDTGEGKSGCLSHRICLNEDKLGEIANGESLDSLIYSYEKGGVMWAGPDFGCVHHALATRAGGEVQ